jgi:hypothetical protein
MGQQTLFERRRKTESHRNSRPGRRGKHLPCNLQREKQTWKMDSLLLTIGGFMGQKKDGIDRANDVLEAIIGKCFGAFASYVEKKVAEREEEVQEEEALDRE